ncbi:MAG: putative multidomain rane protein [Marmoricola sp.]|nr:putative multidomain rane protein [Marmoricola sp.]
MARSGNPARLDSRRRRQRSVRVTVAVVLLAVATVAVLAALPTQSAALLSASSVGAIVLAWAALRIVWTEVLQSRREHATDRAATASAYRSLFSERAAEHAEFTTAMTERLAESTTSVHELQGELVKAKREAAVVTRRADAAESAHAGALVRVAELERSIDLLRTEQAAALAAAHEAAQEAVRAVQETDLFGESTSGSVEDLMSFDEKIAKASGKHARSDAKLA